MLFAFICNLLFYLLINIYRVRYLSKFFLNKGFFNPLVVVFIIQLPMEISKIFIGPVLLLDNGVSNAYYNYALFVTNIAACADLLLLLIASIISKRYKFILPGFSFPISYWKMRYASFFFYLLYVVCFILLSASSFGVLNWILSPREGYQLHRAGAGQYWVFAISSLSVSFAIIGIYIESYRKIFILLFLYVFSAYLLGSKAIVLDLFTFLFVILWLRGYKHMKAIYTFGLPLAFLLLIVNFISTAQDAGLIQILSYFDHYVNSTKYFEAYFTGQIKLFYGQIYFSDFWTIVPRGLVAGKPYVYGITLVNEYFWPGAAELTNTPAFGGPVAYFADFGLTGVVLLTLINPLKFCSYFFLVQLLKDFNYQEIKNNSAIFCLFILFQAPSFLSSMAFPVNIIFYLIIVAILIFFNRFSFRSGNSEAAKLPYS